MKQVVILAVLTAAAFSATSGKARANTVEYQRQLIIHEMETKIQLITTRAQQRLRANDYNNATAISQDMRREIEQVRDEAIRKLRRIPPTQPAAQPTRPSVQPTRPAVQVNRPAVQMTQPAVQMTQPPAGFWAYHPYYGWIYFQQ